jgi:hypothetical protein
MMGGIQPRQAKRAGIQPSDSSIQPPESNRNTPETGIAATHSKQTTVVLSNRNKKPPPGGVHKWYRKRNQGEEGSFVRRGGLRMTTGGKRQKQIPHPHSQEARLGSLLRRAPLGKLRMSILDGSAG